MYLPDTLTLFFNLKKKFDLMESSQMPEKFHIFKDK